MINDSEISTAVYELLKNPSLGGGIILENSNKGLKVGFEVGVMLGFEVGVRLGFIDGFGLENGVRLGFKDGLALGFDVSSGPVLMTIGTIMTTARNKTETTSFTIVSRPHRFSLGMGSLIGSTFSPIPIT